VRNVETGEGAIVVGAHYDTVPGSPATAEALSSAPGEPGTVS
jgi:hypothetical protein